MRLDPQRRKAAEVVEAVVEVNAVVGKVNFPGIVIRCIPLLKKKKKEEKSKAKSNKATKTVVAASNPPANAATAFDSDSNGGVDIDSFFGKMVAAGDTDGDGLVSLEEAIALGMDTATFSAIDADGNGQLTKAEVTSWSEKNEAAAEDMLNEDGDFEC
eukprot:gene19928-28175_t